LGLGDLKDFLVGISEDEVRWPEMAALLERHRRMADRSTASLNRQITLILEHRQALITAAVEGAVDIPGVAA